MKAWLLSLFILLCHIASAQVSGYVTDTQRRPLLSANVVDQLTGRGTTTNRDGFFRLNLPDSSSVAVLRISYIGYYSVVDTLYPPYGLVTDTVQLPSRAEELSQVEISGNRFGDPGLTVIQPRAAQYIPNALNEFNAITATLAGVSSSNDLSSTYRVRGGNFDENMIFVNGIPVYRPFFIRAAQQEGMSFVNPDMVAGIGFSAGGWSARYGDRLSSLMLIEYQHPDTLEGRVSASALGGSVYAGGRVGNTSVSVGARYRNLQYLLNAIEVEGQYFPRFGDIQVNARHFFDTKGKGLMTLDVLASFSANDYEVFPESRQTTFGTFTEQRSLFVGLTGAESTSFRVWQGGMRLQHDVSDRFQWQGILSGFLTTEREFSDVEGAYILCRIRRGGDFSPNQCLQTLGVGSNYNYARNSLSAGIITAQLDATFLPSDVVEIESGIGYQYRAAEDLLYEFSFLDSAGFIRFNEQDFARIENEVAAHHVYGYGQITYQPGRDVTLKAGIRPRYNTLNQQLTVGANMRMDAGISSGFRYFISTGLYHQPPFYREMRDFNGSLNTRLLAQSSLHVITGLQKNYRFWGRPFVFSVEGYYKYLYHLIPYDVDNVRVRYYANNDATGYVYGTDIRISGEFIPGAQSWINLGVLSARENLGFDDRDDIRRPSDQRINVSVFFQDYLPNNPTFRYTLNLQIGSGIPFGPPNTLALRNAFESETFRRIDMGFYKYFRPKNRYIGEWQVGVTILNLLGFENEISYLWIQELSGIQVAAPNTISARLFNLQTILTF